MTTTNPVSTPTTSTNTGASSNAATKQLAGNFQTFLTLLTTQLQNQDPTSPMDSNQFTQQLVQYSQVEQQIATNDNLTKLISLSQSQSTNLAMSYLGKNIVLDDGSGLLQTTVQNTSDGSKTVTKGDWTYGLDNIAKSTVLTVKDANGKIVYSKSLTAAADNTAGGHTFSWDGKDNNGDLQSDGLYTLVVSAIANDGSTIKTSVASKAQVGGVDLSGTSPQLVIGNSEVPLSSATFITN